LGSGLFFNQGLKLGLIFLFPLYLVGVARKQKERHFKTIMESLFGMGIVSFETPSKIMNLTSLFTSQPQLVFHSLGSIKFLKA